MKLDRLLQDETRNRLLDLGIPMLLVDAFICVYEGTSVDLFKKIRGFYAPYQCSNLVQWYCATPNSTELQMGFTTTGELIIISEDCKYEVQHFDDNYPAIAIKEKSVWLYLP